MSFILARLTQVDKNILPNLLLEIDKKIYTLARIKLDNIRYGMTNYVNYEQYEDLKTYKEIIKNIMYCSDTLCSVDINRVIAMVKKLTNSIC